ncbi:hypothetical protein [Mucilaginibacter paludis]|uniref:Uncharacterized protein n=1 Tax=Mucilaginibacter paludis DSM 18603 TaxID=714943 RepID=H1YAI1_9SPHI|nr:hypothetical protein [Mucilaginibacter paludis]EHQ29101.1 hypothetical protein Mucpa_5022 [Mucilaginibacter paludis DSM 18603]
MLKQLKNIAENVFTLILAVVLLIAISYNGFEDLIFSVSNIQGYATIKKIQKPLLSDNPFKITVQYFNQFENKQVICEILLKKTTSLNLYVGKEEKIYYGRFFYSNVSISKPLSIKPVTITMEILALIILIASIFITYRKLKKISSSP